MIAQGNLPKKYINTYAKVHGKRPIILEKHGMFYIKYPLKVRFEPGMTIKQFRVALKELKS